MSVALVAELQPSELEAVVVVVVEVVVVVVVALVVVAGRLSPSIKLLLLSGWVEISFSEREAGKVCLLHSPL